MTDVSKEASLTVTKEILLKLGTPSQKDSGNEKVSFVSVAT